MVVRYLLPRQPQRHGRQHEHRPEPWPQLRELVRAGPRGRLSALHGQRRDLARGTGQGHRGRRQPLRRDGRRQRQGQVRRAPLCKQALCSGPTAARYQACMGAADGGGRGCTSTRPCVQGGCGAGLCCPRRAHPGTWDARAPCVARRWTSGRSSSTPRTAKPTLLVTAPRGPRRSRPGCSATRSTWPGSTPRSRTLPTGQNGSFTAAARATAPRGSQAMSARRSRW